MDILELIQHYLADCLPEDVTLRYVPITKTAYGEYQVDRHWKVPVSRGPSTECFYKGKVEVGFYQVWERTTLNKFRSKDQLIFAGYGEKTKILIIGKEKPE